MTKLRVCLVSSEMKTALKECDVDPQLIDLTALPVWQQSLNGMDVDSGVLSGIENPLVLKSSDELDGSEL